MYNQKSKMIKSNLNFKSGEINDVEAENRMLLDINKVANTKNQIV